MFGTSILKVKHSVQHFGEFTMYRERSNFMWKYLVGSSITVKFPTARFPQVKYDFQIERSIKADRLTMDAKIKLYVSGKFTTTGCQQLSFDILGRLTPFKAVISKNKQMFHFHDQTIVRASRVCPSKYLWRSWLKNISRQPCKLCWLNWLNWNR